MKKVLVYYISGLGSSPAWFGRWVNDPSVRDQIVVMTAKHDDPVARGAIAHALPEYSFILGAGHSLGGFEAYEIVRNATVQLDVLCLIDPVRPSSGGFAFLSHPLEVLPNVTKAVCYFGTLDWVPRGVPFASGPVDDGVYNVPEHVPHGEMDSCSDVETFIGAQIIQLCEMARATS